MKIFSLKFMILGCLLFLHTSAIAFSAGMISKKQYGASPMICLNVTNAEIGNYNETHTVLRRNLRNPADFSKNCYLVGTLSTYFSASPGDEFGLFIQLKSYYNDEKQKNDLLAVQQKTDEKLIEEFANLTRKLEDQRQYLVNEIKTTILTRIDQWPASLITNEPAYKAFREQLVTDLETIFLRK